MHRSIDGEAGRGVDNSRAVRAGLTATALFAAAIIVWATIVHQHLPEGTLVYELVVLVGSYGMILALGLRWAWRGCRADRRLQRHGYEGWATVTSVRALHTPQDTGEIAEIEMRFVVPGGAPYAGRLVRMLEPHERRIFTPGATLPIRVDPRNRDHVMVQPQVMPQ